MTLKLYCTDVSPPARAVYLTAKILGVPFEHVEISLREGDHLKPEFQKINPQHTIPVLVLDDGKIIWDSHAINVYLVTKYGKNDSLYPKDPYKRAIVDQRLHFDSGVLFSLVRLIVRPIMYQGVKTVPQDKIDEVETAYDFLNKFLEGHEWVAGNEVTIADFSVLTSITALNVFVPVNKNKYPNVVAWLERAGKLPHYKETNQKGLDEFTGVFKQLLS